VLHGKETLAQTLRQTVNVFGVVLFDQSVRLIEQYDTKHINRLSKRLSEGLLAMEHTTLNGDPDDIFPKTGEDSSSFVCHLIIPAGDIIGAE
jgi:selenocysteine lyase/cysteine desulfurase